MQRLLGNLRFISPRHILNDVAFSINTYSSEDLQLLLGYICSQNDINLDIKLLFILSKFITANEYHNEAIIKYEGLFDKLENILSRGLSLKTTYVLNFISALIYTNDEDVFPKSQSLKIHVRNMIRVSGCLRIMSAYFIHSMMYPETWKALCLCISLCCHDCDLNKAQCAHLIPVGIEKCHQELIDATAVILSLIKDNSKNLTKFLSCNGLSIFTWKVLQNVKCLELLCTVVYSSKEAANSIGASKLPQHLAQLLGWNGTKTQKGQWYSLILYYLDQHKKSDNINTNINIKKMLSLTEKINPNLIQTNGDTQKEASNNNVNENESNNTMDLFQNIVKEVLYWKKESTDRNETKPLKEPLNQRELFKIQQCNADPPNNIPSQQFQYDTDKSCKDEQQELSFSFLPENPVEFYAPNKVKYLCRNANQNKRSQDLSLSKSVSNIKLRMGDNNNEVSIGTDIFIPVITSTPKAKEHNTKSTRSNYIENKELTVNKHQQAKERRRATRRVAKRRLKHKSVSTQSETNVTFLEKSQSVTDVTRNNRSMTARFFTAINESCTTFVKSVRDVFTPWKPATNTEENNKNDTYSFMNYMKKRDALMNNDKTHQLLENLSCRTCNDTIQLKNKLDNDEHLKKTLQRLKTGINLFGCDFKKISRTMWPHEEYMTPAVLYNLYRKLILK